MKSVKARHIPIRKDWLGLRTEAPIDPARPIIDAHHHLWEKPESFYTLDEALDNSRAGHNVVGTVFAEGRQYYLPDGDEAVQPLGETIMAANVARDSLDRTKGAIAVCAGIVGRVDLSIGERAGEILDMHIEAGDGRFRGVRNTSAWHADPEARGSIVVPPPGLLYEEGFRQGLAELTKRNLVLDAWMYHTQLFELVDLVTAMPDAQIVLNHQGGPIGMGPYSGRRADVFEDWRHFMAKLARHDNISVKLGGFGMLMSGFDFHERDMPPSSADLAEAWGPYFQTCIELFGTSRCMFESNFPVDNGTASYGILWNAFKLAAKDCSDAEKHDLFFATANRVYTLGLACPQMDGGAAKTQED